MRRILSLLSRTRIPVSAPIAFDPAQIVRRYFGLATGQVSPADLPASTRLLHITTWAYIVLGTIGGLLMPQSGPLGAIFVEVILVLASLWLILKVAGKSERFLQTATAIMGVQLVLIPFMVLGLGAYLRLNKDPVWQLPVSAVAVVLGLWVLVINTRILRSATEWPLVSCIMLVMAQVLLAQIILITLFPEWAAGAAPAAVGSTSAT